MHRILIVLMVASAGWPNALAAQDPIEHGTLKYVDRVQADELQNVVSIDLPADGKYVYTAAYNAKAVCVFPRDGETGKFNGAQTLSDSEKFDGVTALRLSPDGRLAATAAFRSHAVTLLRRDAQDGSLQLLDVALQSNDPALKLNFAVDVAWSPDSRFVYVIASASAAVSVFQIDGQSRLKLVQVHNGDGRSLAGARGIALSPDGATVYITSEVFSTLTVLARDAKSGALTLKQVIQDEQRGVRSIGGAFSVAVSPDGKSVYVSAGRFRGDSAISVFRQEALGDLQLVQELVGGSDDLASFVGGNEILISRDGRNAYAVASRSNSLVSFRRDTATGKLTQLQALIHETDGVGPLAVVSGLGISPDGKYLYAAAEESGAVSIFRRTIAMP